ncbi:MAG: peptide chain release factor N(5)-glutamine methyltransferase [Rhodoluna sp.]|nr:peptide chain release factor N(5)-glutamine methyltransferase [Rhodoluna sp.]
MLLSELLDRGTRAFEAAEIESARVDAELIVAFVLGVSRGELQAKVIMGESLEDTAKVDEFFERRAAREPLQHLTGEAYFRNLTLKVGKGVFVPRPETELLTQLAIDAAAKSESPIVIDLCAGSGAIGIAIATELTEAKVFAVEKSEDAYPYTKANYEALAPHATLILGDAVDAFQELNGTVQVVVSNPPYIPAAMVPIYPEVALHDPALALYSGDDGLDLIRLISKRAQQLLIPGGTVAMEHADMQSEAVVQLLLADGWREVIDHKDFNGRPRAVTAIK